MLYTHWILAPQVILPASIAWILFSTKAWRRECHYPNLNYTLFVVAQFTWRINPLVMVKWFISSINKWGLSLSGSHTDWDSVIPCILLHMFNFRKAWEITLHSKNRALYGPAMAVAPELISHALQIKPPCKGHGISLYYPVPRGFLLVLQATWHLTSDDEYHLEIVVCCDFVWQYTLQQKSRISAWGKTRRICGSFDRFMYKEVYGDNFIIL